MQILLILTIGQGDILLRRRRILQSRSNFEVLVKIRIFSLFQYRNDALYYLLTLENVSNLEDAILSSYLKESAALFKYVSNSLEMD